MGILAGLVAVLLVGSIADRSADWLVDHHVRPPGPVKSRLRGLQQVPEEFRLGVAGEVACKTR